MARTRILLKTISEMITSVGFVRSGFFSRLDRITSTRSLGRMKPPAPVSGEISVEIARMPPGNTAAMNPEPLALTSFTSRIGSPPSKRRARARARPGLPLHFVRSDGLPEPDIRLGDQDVDRGQWRRCLGHHGLGVGATCEIGGNAPRRDGAAQNHKG